jgi:hypothetical protein
MGHAFGKKRGGGKALFGFLTLSLRRLEDVAQTVRSFASQLDGDFLDSASWIGVDYCFDRPPDELGRFYCLFNCSDREPMRIAFESWDDREKCCNAG